MWKKREWNKKKVKSELRKTLIIRSFKLVHLLASVGVFVLSWTLFVNHYGIQSPKRYVLLVYAMYTLAFAYLSRVFNAYLIEYAKPGDIILSLSLAAIISGAVVYMAVSIAWNQWHIPVVGPLYLALQILLNIVWAKLGNRLYYKLYTISSAVVVYRKQADLKRLKDIERFDKKFDITKTLENPKSVEEIIDALENTDTLFMVGVEATIRNGVAQYCVANNITCYFLPHIGDVLMMGGKHMQAFSVPIMRVTPASLNPEYAALKRFLDILLSLIGILVLWPFMLITAAVIKLYDHGPALYKQTRLTTGGKEFKILKFRSMRVDAEKDGVARLSTGENDDRITPIGKVIRAIRFDELPQLFNILKGDMSIVGPRPERPEIAAQYEETLPAFRLRLQVKAGLTGYAQLFGRYNTDPYDKLELDLIYINKINILLDLQIDCMTIKVLFQKESTEGIKEGNIVAIDNDEYLDNK